MIPGGYDKHFPVMLQEVLTSLAPQDGKTYVDATFGNGGYSEAILKAANCNLIALDRDPNVLPRAEDFKQKYGSRFRFISGCFGDFEKALIKTAKELNIPFVLVFNKADILPESDVSFDFPFIRVSAEKKTNIEELKEILKTLVPDYVKNAPPLLRDLIKKGDTVICVCPIDASAPKGRLILPQVQAIRDILDAQAFAYTVQNAEDCKNAINNMKTPPALVVTDSQLIRQVKDAVPPSIPLTTFSTLFARYKGDLKKLCDGAEKLKNLKDGDKVLIAEACSHHVQEDDIARVKIPAAVKKACGKNISFDFAAGIDFPADLEKYALVIHCGGCMLSRLETLRRLNECSARGVPVTNFGIALSAAQGILDRVVEPFITDEK